MSNSTFPPAQSQVNSLTKRQQQKIDLLLALHPAINPSRVSYSYQHHYFARNYFVIIRYEMDDADRWTVNSVITRCDWKHTAQAKVDQIRAYIANKQGGAA